MGPQRELHVSFFSKLFFLMELRVKVISFFLSFLSFYCKIIVILKKKTKNFSDHLSKSSLPSFLRIITLFLLPFSLPLLWSYLPSEFFISVDAC